MARLVSLTALKHLSKGRQATAPLIRLASSQAVYVDRTMEASDRLAKPLTQRQGEFPIKIHLNIIFTYFFPQ